MTTLRPYQERWLAAIREAGRSHRRVMGQLPTGAGKTVVFTHDAADEPGRVLILAHRRELIGQALKKALAYGLPATTFPSAHPGRVTVASIQSLGRRLGDLPRFKRIIFDEGHHGVAPTYQAIAESQPDASILLVTATPQRLDGRGLRECADVLVCGPPVADLTDAGYLAPARVFGPPPTAVADLTGVRTLAGDYRPGDLEKVMTRPTLLGSGPAHYGRIAKGRKAIAFCASVEHAKQSAQAFRDAGFRFVAVYGAMDPVERDRALLGLAEGRLDGLTSFDLIGEGLDIPDVSCVIMQRPTQSLILFLQWCGRAARIAAGKADYLVLDHAGNTFRHGWPWAAREWSLDAPKGPKLKTLSVRQCPACFALHPPAPVCPECGHDYRVEEAAAEARRIEEEAGELLELSADDRRIRALKNTPLSQLLKEAMTYDDLAEIGKARGFHEGWAVVRSRFLPRPKGGTDGSEFAS